MEILSEFRKNNIEPKRVRFVHEKSNKESTLDNINHGLNLQLPVYIYLVKNRDKNLE